MSINIVFLSADQTTAETAVLPKLNINTAHATVLPILCSGQSKYFFNNVFEANVFICSSSKLMLLRTFPISLQSGKRGESR